MKVTIIGIHHINQTVYLEKEHLERSNKISQSEEKLDPSLIKLALKFNEAKIDTSLIANFSSHPLFMVPLSLLEKRGITVLPDLKDELNYKQVIKTFKNDLEFTPEINLDLQAFHHEQLRESDVIITNEDSLDVISYITNFGKNKIIVYNNIPGYRALKHIEGIAVKEEPENLDLHLESMMKSGLSWMAYEKYNSVYFLTLRHKIRLDYKNIEDFLVDFVSLDKKDIGLWIINHTV